MLSGVEEGSEQGVAGRWLIRRGGLSKSVVHMYAIWRLLARHTPSPTLHCMPTGMTARGHQSTPTRAADVVARIRADLIRGLYGAGARLKEGELADRYGTSRTPVREALRTLARAGLLQHRPQAGYVVDTPSLGDMDDLYSIRVAIEEQVASRIVDLADLSALEPLEAFWSAEPAPVRRTRRAGRVARIRRRATA